MFRKLLLAALAALTLGATTLTATAPAEARRGFIYPYGGGGLNMRPHYWGGGGAWNGHPGYWGGGRRWYGYGYGYRHGWYGDNWGWGAGLALAAPLLLAPALYGGYGDGYYDDGYYYDYGPVCRWRRVRIYTDYGWAIRRQRVCYRY